MPQAYDTLRVFISSPMDVEIERDLAKKAIQKINSTCKETLGLELESVSWDDFIPQTPPPSNKRIQDILNAEIPRCQVFLLILWRRYGSKEPGHRKSNTEREVDIALKVLKKEKKIMFLSYFRIIPPNVDIGPQEKSVTDFRNALKKKGVWFKEYKDPPDFYEQLIHDLYKTLLRYRLSTNKHKALRKFWVLGVPDRPTQPNLAIIYPSMERTFMGGKDDKGIWLNRLEPNVVFEDLKALQKIEKTLRLIGYRSFRIFNSASMPPDLLSMNRFWICLPRNNPGLQRMKCYDRVSRFEVVRKPNRADSYIKWKASLTKGNYIIIKSPLAVYLKEQRSKLNISGEWHYEMDHIVAKDYAILARYRDSTSEVAMEEGALHDYFLAGLRGLGTWGAAWFIDRKYRYFESLKEDRNIQFLLEVEYRDGRIYDVHDVSDKPQRYFSHENSLTCIRKNIRSYLHVTTPKK